MILTLDYIRKVSGRLTRRQPGPLPYRIRESLRVDIPEISEAEMPVALVREGAGGNRTLAAQTRWDGDRHWVPLTGHAPGNPFGTVRPAEMSPDYLLHCGVYGPHAPRRNSDGRLGFPVDTVRGHLHDIVEDDRDAAMADMEDHFAAQLMIVGGVLHSRIVEPHYRPVRLQRNHSALRLLVDISHLSATHDGDTGPLRWSLSELDIMREDASSVLGVTELLPPEHLYSILVEESVTADMSLAAPPLVVRDILRRLTANPRLDERAFGGMIEQLGEILEAGADADNDTLLAAAQTLTEALPSEFRGQADDGIHGISTELAFAFHRWNAHVARMDDAPISVLI